MSPTKKNPSPRKLRQKLLFVVRELGSRMNPSRLQELDSVDNAVVLVQQFDESEPELLDRACRRLGKIDYVRDALDSAVIACSDASTPEILSRRYALARRMMRALSAGGRLALALDASASAACRHATATMARLLTEEFAVAAPLGAIGASVLFNSTSI